MDDLQQLARGLTACLMLPGSTTALEMVGSCDRLRGGDSRRQEISYAEAGGCGDIGLR